MSRQIPRQGFSLEEKLKTNALEMVASNISNIDAVILLSLVQRIVASGRADIETGLARIISGNPQALKAYQETTGKGMIKDIEDELDFLTLPKIHRRQLAGLQQLQERLMPAGYLMATSEKESTADTARMMASISTQIEKVLRMTKAVKANAEVARLKEAVAEGLRAVGAKWGKDRESEVLSVLQQAMRDYLGKSKTALEKTMQDAEEMGG